MTTIATKSPRRGISVTNAVLLIGVASICLTPLAVKAEPGSHAKPWFSRVLITNDNGIDDPKIHALAEAFSEVAETWVVAASQDRSGTGAMVTVVRSGQARVQPRELGEGITAFALDGYPADCVIWALTGPMRDAPPDLVVSGINGGANLGIEWFGSGTIGAARTAALAGLPALAISGLDDDDAAAVEAVVGWTVALAASDVTKTLPGGSYLTASIPETSPENIKGVKVVPREPGLGVLEMDAVGEDGPWQMWQITAFEPPAPGPGTDIAEYLAGWIVVVPMSVDEIDGEMIGRLGPLPAWPGR